MKRITLMSVCLILLLFFGFLRNGLAKEAAAVDLSLLIQETQKMSSEANDMTMVWWIPEEFWRANFAQDSTITPEQTEEFVNVLKPYTIIVVINGKVGTFGGLTYTPEAALRSDIKIKDGSGTPYSPLINDNISADAKNFLDMMKPIFINMLGQMGQNMHFFVFPGKNKGGQDIVAAKKDGVFSVEIGKKEFKWRLPLSSLVPQKVCPTCKENLNGAYKFCPYDGTKLPTTN